MTQALTHETSFEPAIGRELSNTELLQVSGGGEVYTTAVGVAIAFVTAAAALTAAPVLAGAFAIGSIGASGVAIFSELNDDSKTES